MVSWGAMGSRTPAVGRKEGAGSERAGSEQGAMGKQVTHVPAVAQPCGGGMSHRNPSQWGQASMV